MGYSDPSSSSPYSVSAAFSAGSLSARTSDGSGAGRRSMTEAWTTMSPASGPSMQRSGPNCTCLPQLVKLVYQLEGLRYSYQPQTVHHSHQSCRPDKSVSSIGSVLRGVQLAEGPWGGLMHCPNVSGPTSIQQSQGTGLQRIDNNHKQALLLFAMSIRILLSAVQTFNNSSSTSTAATLNHNSTISSLATDDIAATIADTIRAGGDRSPIHADQADILVSVGGVELSGEARAEIIDASVRRSLRVITAALVHLWDQTGRPSNQTLPPSQMAFPPPNFGRSNNAAGGGVNLSASGAHLMAVSGGERSENVSSLLDTLQYAMDALGE